MFLSVNLFINVLKRFKLLCKTSWYMTARLLLLLRQSIQNPPVILSSICLCPRGSTWTSCIVSLLLLLTECHEPKPSVSKP